MKQILVQSTLFFQILNKIKYYHCHLLREILTRLKDKDDEIFRHSPSWMMEYSYIYPSQMTGKKFRSLCCKFTSEVIGIFLFFSYTDTGKSWLIFFGLYIVKKSSGYRKINSDSCEGNIRSGTWKSTIRVEKSDGFSNSVAILISCPCPFKWPTHWC